MPLRPRRQQQQRPTNRQRRRLVAAEEERLALVHQFSRRQPRLSGGGGAIVPLTLNQPTEQIGGGGVRRLLPLRYDRQEEAVDFGSESLRGQGSGRVQENAAERDADVAAVPEESELEISELVERVSAAPIAYSEARLRDYVAGGRRYFSLHVHLWAAGAQAAGPLVQHFSGGPHHQPCHCLKIKKKKTQTKTKLIN